MNTRFKPGDSVRTPRGYVGTVNCNISNGNHEVDVEITAIERFLEAELEPADPSAITKIGELENFGSTLLTERNAAQSRAAELQVSKTNLERQVAELQRKLSRPKARTARKTSKKRR